MSKVPNTIFGNKLGISTMKLMETAPPHYILCFPANFEELCIFIERML